MKSLLALAMAGYAAAQTSTISAFIPVGEHEHIVASIIGNDATATTYLINCPEGTDPTECGWGSGYTMVSGPKTAGVSYSDVPVDFFHSIGCSMGGTTTAICTSSVGGDGANSPGEVTETLTGSDIVFQPVTVTAGSLTSADGAAPTATNESGSPPSPSSSDGPPPATTTSLDDGMPQVTGNARLVLGGAAVAVAAMI